MIRKKLLAAALAVTMVLTGLPGQTVKSQAATEITLAKSQYTNPIGCVDNNGNRIYGGDPSVLVDGDTVYLYVGHDNSTDSEVNRAIYNMGIMSLHTSAEWFAAAFMIILALPLGLIFARILTDKTFRYCT